jgi:hypothetical protein
MPFLRQQGVYLWKQYPASNREHARASFTLVDDPCDRRFECLHHGAIVPTSSGLFTRGDPTSRHLVVGSVAHERRCKCVCWTGKAYLDDKDRWPDPADPGLRTINVSGFIAGPPGSMCVADAELQITLQANQSDTIHGSCKDRAMTFWFEDKTTGKLVGESRTVPTSLEFRP